MMDDLISRQAAIDAINKAFERVFAWDGTDPLGDKVLENVPSVQPQPEEDCATCKHGYFGDRQCDNCRMRYPSHYEREEEHHGSY